MVDVAMKVLCIPATSCASERIFSTAGWIQNHRRLSLKGMTLGTLVFLHDFLKKELLLRKKKK